MHGRPPGTRRKALPKSCTFINGHGQINAQPQAPTSPLLVLRIDSRKVGTAHLPSSVLPAQEPCSPGRSPLQSEAHAELCRGRCVMVRPFPSPGSGGYTAAARGQRGFPAMTTENSTPILHSSAKAPKKINHHLSCPVGFMCLLLDRRFEEEGGVHPISIERCRPCFLFCSFAHERPFCRIRRG
jgi:hypothetical protein